MMKIVAFLGPDGAGKSTLIRAVSSRIERSGHPVMVFHTRPKFGRATVSQSIDDPHGGMPYGSMRGSLKLAFWLLDYWWSLGGMRLRHRLNRGRASPVVLFDRYIIDLLVDPRRARLERFDWLCRVAVRLAPRPDSLYILQAPLTVVQSRKCEVPPEETRRQATAYSKLASQWRGAVVIDTDRPVDQLADGVMLDLGVVHDGG
jgi:thymidylate kinase